MLLCLFLISIDQVTSNQIDLLVVEDTDHNIILNADVCRWISMVTGTNSDESFQQIDNIVFYDPAIRM